MVGCVCAVSQVGTIDYYLGSEVETSRHLEVQYSEQLVKMR